MKNIILRPKITRKHKKALTFKPEMAQKLLILLLFALLSIRVQAQSTSSIQGRVVDPNNQPIEFVNVWLFAPSDTTHLLGAAVSDSIGAFQIALPTSEKALLLRFQTVGYRIKSLQIDPNAPDLGAIALTTDARMLSAVEVTAKRELLQKTAQGYVINADATLTQAGGTGVDLLRNAPTVFVDGEGAVTLRGKSPLILLDGRNSTLINLATIPASSIESIEILNNPSAAYDAAAENGIINIRLRKKRQSGTNGAFALGAGYGAHLRALSSAQIQHKTTAWNLNAGYDNRFAGRTRRLEGERVNFREFDRHFLTQRRSDDRNERTHNARLGADYERGRSSLSLEAIGSFEDGDDFETLFSTFETQNRDFTSKNRRFSEELSQDRGVELAASYEYKGAKPRQKWTTSASSSVNSSRENTDIDTRNLTINGTESGNPFLQRTHFYEDSRLHNARTDYYQSIGRGLFSTGYKMLLRHLDADFQQQDERNGTYITQRNTSGLLTFREQVHAAYGQYQTYTGQEDAKKTEWTFGLRVEQTINRGTIVASDLRFSNRYANLFPSAAFTWHITPDKNLQLNYGRRINRPDLDLLNPFTDITDSLTQRSGNPNLQPELVHAFELGFDQDFNKVSFIGKLFYRSGINSIFSFTNLRPDGVLFSAPINAGQTHTYGAETVLSYRPRSFWNGNLSASLFQKNINAGNISVEAVNRVFSWNMKWINDFSVWKGGKWQVIGIYNAPTATIQGTRIATYNIDMAFQQRIGKGNSRLALIVTDVFDTLESGTLWDTPDFTFSRLFKVDTRAVLLTYAHTFGTQFKEKLLENQFSNQ